MHLLREDRDRHVAVRPGVTMRDAVVRDVLCIETIPRYHPALAGSAGDQRIAWSIAVRAFQAHQRAGFFSKLDRDGFVFHHAMRGGVSSEVEVSKGGGCHGNVMETLRRDNNPRS